VEWRSAHDLDDTSFGRRWALGSELHIPAEKQTQVRRGTIRQPERFNRKGNIPRVARLLALAIRFDGLVRRGEVQDYADLARLGYVTRARITQIMNLLNLAPDIQEDILFLPNTTKGRDLILERYLRPSRPFPTGTVSAKCGRRCAKTASNKPSPVCRHSHS
jgi:hypothetical protein